MANHLIVWDLETVPDLPGFAAANGHDRKTDDEIREAMGDKFPKHIYHSIICIGALVAHRDNEHWIVDALGTPHVGERPEKELKQQDGKTESYRLKDGLLFNAVKPGDA